jgi:hypothetical protein
MNMFVGSKAGAGVGLLEFGSPVRPKSGYVGVNIHTLICIYIYIYICICIHTI